MSSKRHYCPDWDYMLIDEGDPEFESCLCFFGDEEVRRRRWARRLKIAFWVSVALLVWAGLVIISTGGLQ